MVTNIEQVEAQLDFLYDWLTSPLMVSFFTLLGTVMVLNSILDRMDTGVSGEIGENRSKPMEEDIKAADSKISKKIVSEVDAKKPSSNEEVFGAKQKTLADLIREHHHKNNSVASSHRTVELVKPEKNMVNSAGSREDYLDPDSEPEATSSS